MPSNVRRHETRSLSGRTVKLCLEQPGASDRVATVVVQKLQKRHVAAVVAGRRGHQGDTRKCAGGETVAAPHNNRAAIMPALGTGPGLFIHPVVPTACFE